MNCSEHERCKTVCVKSDIKLLILKTLMIFKFPFLGRCTGLSKATDMKSLIVWGWAVRGSIPCVSYIRQQTDYDLQDIVNDTHHLFGDIQVLVLVWILFSLLAMASSASAASAGSSMISKYISQVRAELQHQRSEAREAWLKAEMDTLQLGSSHEGKPSAREVCKHLNMAVSEKKGKLTLKTLKMNLVEKFMSEIGHEVDSASASAGSSGLCSKYMSQVRAELRRQHPETRESWLEGEMDSMNHKTSHLGTPSVRDCCKYLNLGVRDDKEISVKNLVENLMSEIGHVTESASASSGVDPAVVKRYVQILRVSLTQQEPHERSSWLQSQFKPLLHRRSKDGMPSVVDIAQFLKLPIAKREGGGIRNSDLILNIIEKLIGDLPDSSAAASAPVIGFVVALSIVLNFCSLYWNDLLYGICVLCVVL